MIIYNTDSARVEYYLPPDNWAAIQAPFAGGHSCTAAIDCASEICVDGYCCNTLCTGNCNHCNVAGSLGTCTDVNSDCTGNCDICSSGNCAANVALCTGNCDTCSGSGTAYSCAAVPTMCTGTCTACTGSGTAYSCTFVANGVTGLNCTAAHYRCDGNGSCTNPTTTFCVGGGDWCPARYDCQSLCPGGLAYCIAGWTGDNCTGSSNYIYCPDNQYNACWCTCWAWTYN